VIDALEASRSRHIAAVARSCFAHRGVVLTGGERVEESRFHGRKTTR
jgi:hypothetical protein